MRDLRDISSSVNRSHAARARVAVTDHPESSDMVKCGDRCSCIYLLHVAVKNATSGLEYESSKHMYVNEVVEY